MIEKMKQKLTESLDDVITMKLSEREIDGKLDMTDFSLEIMNGTGGISDIFNLKYEFDVLPDSDAIKVIPEFSKIFKSKIEEVMKMDVSEDKRADAVRMLYSLHHMMGLEKRERMMQQKKNPKGGSGGGGAVGSTRRAKKIDH